LGGLNYASISRVHITRRQFAVVNNNLDTAAGLIACDYGPLGPCGSGKRPTRGEEGEGGSDD
jgi:hypothetical protein